MNDDEAKRILNQQIMNADAKLLDAEDYLENASCFEGESVYYSEYSMSTDPTGKARITDDLSTSDINFTAELDEEESKETKDKKAAFKNEKNIKSHRSAIGIS